MTYIRKEKFNILKTDFFAYHFPEKVFPDAGCKHTAIEVYRMLNIATFKWTCPIRVFWGYFMIFVRFHKFMKLPIITSKEFLCNGFFLHSHYIFIVVCASYVLLVKGGGNNEYPAKIFKGVDSLSYSFINSNPDIPGM
jgi:hypothetical protein